MVQLTTSELLLIEQKVTNAGKSAGLAYVFWLFGGIISAHRLYLGRPITAILQILSYLIVVGFVWLIIDLFLIPGMVRDHQDEERRRLMKRFRDEKDES
jgi:TM2 domain-containing membrane protein YozV